MPDELNTTEPDRRFWLAWEAFMWSTIVGSIVVLGWLVGFAHYG